MNTDTVLVVEDDDDVRRSCAEILRTAGYEVIEAEDGVSALEQLKSSRIGAVVLDVSVPGLNGLSLLDEIASPPPVALLTAHAYDDAIVVRRAKVTLYIQKPADSLVLLEAVASLFSRN
jgi:DNA-binding response OmpR family regulator